MWLVSLLGYGPSSVTPYGVPPSPWGKATSGGGAFIGGPAFTFRGPLHTRPGLRPVRRGKMTGFLRLYPSVPPVRLGADVGIRPYGGGKMRKSPCAEGHRGETILSNRNPGSFVPGWGAAASGWPCFRSGGFALSSRRRSGPPLPGCGSGRRTYRSASAAHRLPAR